MNGNRKLVLFKRKTIGEILCISLSLITVNYLQ